jgi:RNA-directed DNA polymerase
MGLILQVADLNHLAQVFSHYQQRHGTASRRPRLHPGSDGQTMRQFAHHLDANLRLLSEDLVSGSYSFAPFLERTITMSGGRTRVISAATVRDTIAQRALALVVEPELDSHISDNCYSFRIGKEAPSIHDALSRAVTYQRAGRYWVVKEDVKSYFENLNHELILAQLCDVFPLDSPIVDLYASYVRAPRLAHGELLRREKGVPVGTILANCLSNLYLRPLDLRMRQEGYLYLRYCDDLIVFAPRESQAWQARKTIADTVEELGLTLNSRKSLLVAPGGRFTYLGYEFDGQEIRIGPRALHKFKMRIRRATSRPGSKRLTRGALRTEEGRATLRQIIAEVNRETGGDTPRNWARYFARCDFDTQFRELDHWIRDRIRGAVTKRWNRANHRVVPTCLLQELGLKSLVGEYYRWKNRWRRREQGLIHTVARLERLHDTLESYRYRYHHPLGGPSLFRPGADGVTMEGFVSRETSNLRSIQDQLLAGTYLFTPFVEYTKAKRGRTDDRVVCRASLADTVVQKSAARAVEPRYDSALSDHCHSYRRGRSQFTAMGRVMALINAHREWWVVRSDFRSFLDTVDLNVLRGQLEELLGEESLLLDLYLKYIYNPRLREGEFLPRTVGLPRGGILTPFLANLYLTPLDEAMAQDGTHYERYADDIVIFADTEDAAQDAAQRLESMTRTLRLTHSPEKTRIVRPGEPFEFLGYEIRGAEVSIRPYALNSLKRRIKRATRKRKWRHLDRSNLNTEEGKSVLRSIISRVNRTYIYSGGNDWTRHFCRCTSDAQLRELDRWIADRIRMAATKRWTTKNRRLIPYAQLRDLGWRPLVPLFYRWKREVWKQGAGSS